MPQNRYRSVRASCRGFLLAIALVALAAQNGLAAKNVILMIADGAGYNTWLATSMYQGKVGEQVYDQSAWAAFSCTTYPLNTSTVATGERDQDPALVYNPAKAWDATKRSMLSKFAGYSYLTTTYTDSAAASTALATGRKTYNNAINWSNEDRPLHGETIAEIAKARQKAVGVVTSVPWSHATPAGLGGAHNRNRNNYAQIASEMLDAPWLDVIMGGGNPDFDDNGRPLSVGVKRDYGYVGGESTWHALKGGHHERTLVQTKAEFEALASGPTPTRLVATAQVASTLQAKRDPAKSKITSVPTLATMTRAAINCLDNNPHGFYLMIEGGAVDWANHGNELDRMIEEHADFLTALEAVVAWVESNSDWNETLLIVTADHECGLLWGPDSSKTAFDPLEDGGPGNLPGAKYHSHGHTNSLVPLFARGAGSERFPPLKRGNDSAAAARWHISGDYIDNTDVFRVMQAEIGHASDD